MLSTQLHPGAAPRVPPSSWEQLHLGGAGNALREFPGTSGSFKFPLAGRGQAAGGRLRFLHCGLRARAPAGPWRPRPSGSLRQGPAARPPAEARSSWPVAPSTPREGRETRRRCGHCVGARAPASPATGGPREEGARGGPAFPPEEAPGGHIAELSAAAAARLLSGDSGLAPPPLRSLAASRDAPAEPRLSQSAAGREGAAHFRGKPCSARSLPPARLPDLPRRGAEVAARSCRAVWRRGPGLARLRDGLACPWPPERRRGR